jgi:hypothetical protein
MKTAFYGQIVCGASAVLFGVITLIWLGPRNLAKPAADLAPTFGHHHRRGPHDRSNFRWDWDAQYPLTARLAAIVLNVVYLCFWAASLASLQQPTSMSATVGASSSSSPYCGAIALLRRLRRVQHLR